MFWLRRSVHIPARILENLATVKTHLQVLYTFVSSTKDGAAVQTRLDQPDVVAGMLDYVLWKDRAVRKMKEHKTPSKAAPSSATPRSA